MNQRIETLEVELTAKERQLVGENLARVLAEIEELKEELAELEAAARIYRDEVNHRRKMVDIDVQDQHNEEMCTVDTVRLDTGEVLRSRPFTAEERQPSLIPDPDAVDRRPAGS